MRKPITIAITALAAMLLSAPAALADPVEVIDPATSEPCPELVQVDLYEWEGGCVREYTGELIYALGAMPWFPDKMCALEVTARIAGDGSAVLSNPTITVGGGESFCGSDLWRQCTTDNTASGDAYPWTMQIGHDGGGNIDTNVSLCLHIDLAHLAWDMYADVTLDMDESSRIGGNTAPFQNLTVGLVTPWSPSNYATAQGTAESYEFTLTDETYLESDALEINEL